MHDPVGLLGDHALDEVDCVVENNSESLLSICACLHGLDLNTLYDRVNDILAAKDAAQAACRDGRLGIGHFFCSMRW